MFGLTGHHSNKQETAPPSHQQPVAPHQSRRGLSQKKVRRGSKKLSRSSAASTHSLDDSGSNDGTKPPTDTNKSSSSFFGRFKQSRRPSMEEQLQTSSEPRYPSMGRRPSLGGSFTTRRPATERRPSMDNSSSARFYADPSSFRDSMSTKTSLSTSRRPSNPLSDDGGSARPPTLIASTSFDYSTSYAAQKPRTHPVIEALKEAMMKDHMMDFALIANDGTRVKTSRYVMACRISYLEHKLYPDASNTSPPIDENGRGDAAAAPAPENPNEISLGNYPAHILQALVEYCFCGELIKSTLKSEETVESVRGLIKLAELASSVQFRVLCDEIYQWARRMMNRNPSLACAVYDAATAACCKEFENYAMQTMEDSPMDALLDGGAECGIQYLSAKRLQDVMSDHDMEVDELTVFHMLQRWVENHTRSSGNPNVTVLSPEETLKVARKCATNIELCYIEEHDLLSSVKDSGFFDDADIEKAIHEQASMGSKRGMAFGLTRGVGSLKNMMVERVEIKGAGLNKVNGIYTRQADRDGQAMYSMGEGPDSIGLFQWENTWGLAPSCDLSNMYYERNQTIVSNESYKVPMYGWTVSLQGENPPPTCRWIAAHTDQSDEEDERHVPACYQNEEELYGN